eukprot:TRINITY_DN98500_c0_g1_i1.p1 TRINITY_DN98500_c0_g1~~TRINITY_DN98500_c0_g1_i1.p1  ORF type:complete len:247 (-),score=46.95 TRINITY_DN98500_c0_g1_i1:68-808(-)
MTTSWDFFGDGFGDCTPSKLPALPDGKQIKLQIGSFIECDISGLLWTGAISLCRWLLNNNGEVRGKAVLELGSGTGACGIFAAALGASRVTLSDGGSPATLANAQANVEANRELWGTETVMEVVPYTWGNLSEEELGGYDWVIASDVTAYTEPHHVALCSSLAEQLRKRSIGCRVIMSHYHRTHGTHAAPDSGEGPARDGTFLQFIAVAAAAGLLVRTLHEDWVDEQRVSVVEVSLSGDAGDEGCS